jgi:uncharacterized protein YvpB
MRGLFVIVLWLGTTSCSALALHAPVPIPTSTRAFIPAATITPDALPSQTPSPNAALPPSETTRATPLPTSLPATATAPALPSEHFILNIRGHHQYFNLGCEAAAAKDWANYFHQDFNEFEFQYKLPLSDNPDQGFVGDVNSPWGQVPPYGYGVHAGPVADLLNVYGIPAKAFKGYTLDQLKAKIAQDKPVIAWVIGNVVGGVPYQYTDSRGNLVTVAAYEHVVIVTGYDTTHLRYMTNGKFFDTPYEVFLNSWSVLGNMVIVDQ